MRRLNDLLVAISLLTLASSMLATGAAVHVADSSPTTYVHEFTIPTKRGAPLSLVASPAGHIWFAEGGNSSAQVPGKIGVYFPANNTFQEYPVPTRALDLQIWGMALDSPGRVWFTEATESRVWRFDPHDRTFQSVPTSNRSAFPVQVAAAPDGTIWFTQLFANRLGRITPSFELNATRILREYTLPVPNSLPSDLRIAGDGRIWLTLAGTGQLAVFDPRTDRFDLITPRQRLITPVGLAFDAAGSAWVTEHGPSRFASIQLNSRTVEFYVTQPGPTSPVTLPYWLEIDHREHIWFNEHVGNRIARFIPATQTLVEYVIPSQRLANILYLTLDPAGRPWFSELTEDKIGYVDPEAPLPFELTVSPPQLRIRAGENAKLTLQLNSRTTDPLTITPRITATTTPIGQLQNATARFTPDRLGLSPGQTASVTLELETRPNLLPGTYRLSVGAAESRLIISRIVQLEVEAPASTFPPPPDPRILGIAVPALGVVAILLFVVMAIRRRSR